MENNQPQEDTECHESGALWCIAPRCRNSHLGSQRRNVNFYTLPVTREVVLQRWLAALGLTTPPSSSNARICGDHFLEEDFLQELYLEGNVVAARATLKPWAVPSVFNPASKTANLQELEAGNPTLDKDVGSTVNFTWQEAGYSRPSRQDNVLCTSTQRFVELLKSSADGVLDINMATAKLNISKRRIYDIIHVLEGICLIRKKSKNFVEWLGGHPNLIHNEELNALVKEERRLDFQIKSCTRHIQQIYKNIHDCRFGYLTYEDIQMLPIFKEQTVFVIKAPPETKLEVPHPAESFQIHIKSTKGPVKVLLCSDEAVNESKSTRRKATFNDGDYSYVPLPCLATTATSSEGFSISKSDDANLNTKNSAISKPPSEDHPNSATLSSPVTVSVNEEQSHLNPPPDETMTDNFALHEHDQLPSDVHMADAS